jgi:glycosyltransferase involved in cell wall biosynthesis
VEIIKTIMQKCTKAGKIIQILLSTYNGEKYLREQLDSYISLENFDHIKVLIRDDGSTDNTIKILEEYRQKYGFEVLKGKNVGVNKSVFELFANCDLSCDYFALSDQDDVWLKNKFTIALNRLSRVDNKKPALFASCSEIVDENLKPLGSSIVPSKGVSFYNAMIQNVAPGHTQVLNKALLLALMEKGIENIHVVDGWIYLVAAGIGEVVFDNQFTVLHRQHGKNSVGYELNFLKSTINRLKRVFKNQSNIISFQLKSFQKLYKGEITPEYKDELSLYLNSQQKVINRLEYVFKCKAYRQTFYETSIFKILFILGRYNIDCLG